MTMNKFASDKQPGIKNHDARDANTIWARLPETQRVALETTRDKMRAAGKARK
jgi:hypothetical protein